MMKNEIMNRLVVLGNSLKVYTLCVSLLLSTATFSVFAQEVKPSARDQLIHATGLLLTFPGNPDIAKNLVQKMEEVIPGQSAEDDEVLKVAAKALRVHQIKEFFNRCLNRSDRAKNLGGRILKSVGEADFGATSCASFGDFSELKDLSEFDEKIQKYMEKSVQNLALEQAQRNFAKTYIYWEKRIDHGSNSKSLSEFCTRTNCTQGEIDNLKKAESDFLKVWPEHERNKKPEDIANFLNMKLKMSSEKENLKSQDELLLFTKALKDKKEISKKDILDAQKEVQDLLEKQVVSVRSMSLKNLVKTNPAALGEILLEKPELVSVICNVINQVAQEEEEQARWDEIYLWGGLIVGGALLITGVGAGVGAVILSGTVMGGTLVTVATASAIAGTALGVGDTLYAGNRSYEAMNEAIALRASAISSNGDSTTVDEADAKMEEAWSSLAEAGVGAVSIIPFGKIWSVMNKTAQASRIGRVRNIDQLSTVDKTEVVNGLSQTIRELSDPGMEKILMKARGQVSEEEYGTFLGQLSQLKPDERLLVMTRMKTHPDKVTDAIKKSRKTCQ